MAQFNIPARKKVYNYEVETFLGIDLTSAPNNVNISRSPNCPNMIRDTIGKVRKRDGYTTRRTYADKINGVHFHGTDKLVHSGAKLYKDGETPTLLSSAMKDGFSVSVVMNGDLFILDGKKMVTYDGSFSDITGKVPLILIGRGPSGGGTVYEAVNLISPYMQVGFLGTAGTVIYQLPHTGLDATDVTAKKMDGSGVFVDLVEDTDFTVDRTAGTVTFDVAPGDSPITGEDNVYITYSKTISGYSDRINKCDTCILYGVNGSRDRLFVTGNPDYPNYDYYSEMSDPTYFPDINYSVLGNKAIVNYSIVNELLVTHKAGEDNNSNAVLREGVLTDDGVAFVLRGSYQTTGALAKHSFSVLENEPLFVSVENNISAITPSDVLGERLSQERSYYITEALKGLTLDDSYSCTYDGFYFLTTGTDIYILDGTQYSYERNRPYSTRQYECYVWPGINARVLWEDDGLWFGTSDGKICEFVSGQMDDDGEAISAYWDTPELDGQSFANKKTFTYVGVRIASAPKTGIKISARVKGLWSEKVPYNLEAMYFSFAEVYFDSFTFSTDSTPHTLGQKIKIRGEDKVQFRFENSQIDEPFGLYKALIEYTESGKYRK